MPVIETKVDRKSEEFLQNAEANVALAEDLKNVSDQIKTGGSARSRERQNLANSIDKPSPPLLYPPGSGRIARLAEQLTLK